MVIKQAIEVLKIEAEGIIKLIDKIDDNFVKMVELICKCKGRLAVSGIGKSGIVAKKIVATLNSTGTKAIFLHPVEAMHGDLGMVSSGDIFLALSNSGETDEMNVLLPSIRKIGCTIIAFTGNCNSSLAKNSDIVIDVGVEKEACPLGLVPTASTTALLAMGDALSVVLINKKKFKKSDFKTFHPGGALGQRLSSKVSDIMLSGSFLPTVKNGISIEDAVLHLDRYGLGTVLITDKNNILCGIITDGDIRRYIAKKKVISNTNVKEIMTENPKTVSPNSPTYYALNLMEQYQITVLPITNSKGQVLGIIHLHDILGKGDFKFNGN